MVSLSIIRKDLQEIRYYYSRRAVFDKGFEQIGVNQQLMKLIELYNNVMSNAPAKLYDIYLSLYVNISTQEGIADELQYSTSYIQKLNTKLVTYLQKQIKQENDIKEVANG